MNSMTPNRETRRSNKRNHVSSDAKTPDVRDQVSHRLRNRGIIGRVLDRFVTLVSGIAPSDVEPIMIWTRPTMHIAVLIWLFGGAAATAAIVASGIPWLLPLLIVTLLITASGARAGMLTIMHDAIHMWVEHPNPHVRTLFWWIGTILSTVLMVEDFPTYAKKHMVHHGEDFARPDDPDVRFIRSLGFEPGMTVEALRARYRTMRWSPWFHWTYFKARLVAQFLRGPVVQRVFNLGLWGGVATLVTTSDVWVPFLVAWVLPVMIMFQRAALEQFMGEHRWLKETDPENPEVVRYAQLSAGRFALDAPPSASLFGLRRVLSWIVWAFRLVFVQAPYRASIVFGDLAHHDEHHVHGLALLHARGIALPRYAQPEIAWMNTAYGRRVYQRLRRDDDPVMTEFWQRDDPLDATFESLSALDPSEVGEATDDAGIATGMLGM